MINCKDDAYLSKELVTIIKDVELEYKLDDFIIKSFDNDVLRKKYEELEFYALLKQLVDTGDSLQNDKIDKKYITVKSLKSLKQLIKDLEQCNILSIDLETTSVDPMTAEIVGISLSFKPDTGFYIPVLYPEKKNNNFGDDDLNIVFILIKRDT